VKSEFSIFYVEQSRVRAALNCSILKTV